MSKDPAFLFYPGDWLGGTLGLTFEQKGAYIDLLMLQFNRGHMTKHMIGQVLGQDSGQIWEAIQDKFIQDEKGNYYNERLEIEKNKRKAYTDSRKNNRSGINQYTKKDKNKSGHMTNHMSGHMENENKDVLLNKKGEKGFLLNDIHNPAFIFMFNECVDGNGKLKDMAIYKNEYACLILNNEALLKRLPVGSDSYNLIRDFIIDNSVTMQEWDSPADLFKHFLNWSRKRVKA